MLLQRENVTLNSNMNMSPLLGGHLFLREQCAWQFSVFWVKDVPGSIYPLIDLDFGFDEMSSLGGGQELNDLSTYGDGIVILYGSVEAFTQDVADIHISRQGTPGRGAIFGLYGEPTAIGRDEVLIEVLSGLVVVSDVAQPQF
jgi:hypothetical protein